MRIYAEKLNFLIEQSGLTQAEFAEKVGISQSAVNNYITDKREPKISVAKKIADYFGVSVDSMIQDDSGRNWKAALLNKFNKVV